MYFRGFTLIELLIVTVILGILAALLLPALSRAKETANRAVCLSNIRQLYLAMNSYAESQNGSFPEHRGDPAHVLWTNGSSWLDMRKALVDHGATPDIAYCPSSSTTAASPGRWFQSSPAGNYAAGYSLFSAWQPPVVVQWVGKEAKQILRQRDADSRLVMLTDMALYANWVGLGTPALPNVYNHPPGEHIRWGTDFTGLNVGFFDGSAKWRYGKETAVQVSVNTAQKYWF